MKINMPIKTVSARATIIKAWLIAGTLDILSAITHYSLKTGKNPFKVLSFVAGGIFGKESFTGGAAMAVAGLFFHYLIAFIWTIFFFLIYPRINSLIKSTVVVGLLYGIFVWAFMNFIVVPMSALPPSKFNISNAVIAMLIIMFAVGLPISIIVSKFYRQKIKG